MGRWFAGTDERTQALVGLDVVLTAAHTPAWSPGRLIAVSATHFHFTGNTVERQYIEIRVAMLPLKQLQEQAYATAREKGWHDRPLCTGALAPDGSEKTACPVVDHDRVLRSQALVHSELSEARAAAEAGQLHMRFVECGKPEGFDVEIADVVIRVCDTCEALGLSLADTPTMRYYGDDWHEVSLGALTSGGYEFAEQLLKARTHVDDATEAARTDDWVAFAEHLARLLTRLAGVCNGLGLDLPAAIAAKMKYNKTRSHRHGGKQA